MRSRTGASRRARSRPPSAPSSLRILVAAVVSITSLLLLSSLGLPISYLAAPSPRRDDSVVIGCCSLGRPPSGPSRLGSPAPDRLCDRGCREAEPDRRPPP